MQYDSTVLRPTTQDLTDQPFGRWTVIGFAGYVRGRVQYWRCECVCGTIKDVPRNALSSGDSRSCGCLKSEMTATRNMTHGKSYLPEYDIWQGMRQRCQDPHASGYYKYGERGITVCEAWQDFEVFYRDMGARPSPQHSIERLRNNEGYRADNCIWATPPIQSRNTRQNVMLTHNGITQCATDWAHSVPMPPIRFLQRIRRGWTMEEALTTPLERTGRTYRRPQA